MRCSLSRGVCVLGFLLLSFVIPPGVNAQEKADTTESTKDVEAPKEGTLSIRIDGSGIRIEGAEHGAAVDTSGASRIIFEMNTRDYREKTTDIVKFGENVFVSRNELVRGDIVVFGGDVAIEGKVIGNVIVLGGEVEIRAGAEINGDVVVLGGELHEDTDVLIHGERVVFKDIEISIGGLTRIFDSHYRGFGAVLIPLSFIVSVVLSLLILLFLRKRIITTQEHIQDSVIKTFGAGFLTVFVASIAAPILFCILIITLIGIPLAIMLLLTCVAIHIIANTVFVYAVGSKISEKFNLRVDSPFGIVVVTVVIGTTVLFVPGIIAYVLSFTLLDNLSNTFVVLWCLLCVFAYLVGVGALFLSRFGSRAVVTATPVSPPPASGFPPADPPA